MAGALPIAGFSVFPSLAHVALAAAYRVATSSTSLSEILTRRQQTLDSDDLPLRPLPGSDWAHCGAIGRIVDAR